MTITSVRYSSNPTRRAPRAGDRRITKKHGEQIRVPTRITSGPHRGAFLCNGGKQNYHWTSLSDPEAQLYLNRSSS